MSRTNFSSSTLVRLLAQATGAGTGTGATGLSPRQDVAERLSHWLNAFDAVALHGIHQSAAAPATAPGATPSGTPGGASGGASGGTFGGMSVATSLAHPGTAAHAAQQAVAERFQRTRTALVAAITAHGRPPPPTKAAQKRQATSNRPLLPPPQPPTPDEAAPDYGVFFKRHLELQREMALKIEPLRAEARQVLARSAVHLRPLAALDALMEQTLAGREHKLLAQVPAMLEKRFEQLRDAPGSGPTAFGREWEAIVLAELHLRLQPVVGMMEAWGASPQTTQ